MGWGGAHNCHLDWLCGNYHGILRVLVHVTEASELARVNEHV